MCGGGGMKGILGSIIADLDKWLLATFQISLGGAVGLIAKRLQKYLGEKSKARDTRMKKIEDDNILLKQAIKAQQKDSIYHMTEEYLVRGFITLPELDNLESMHNSYLSLGGDTSTDFRFEKCKELPLHSSGDDDLDGYLVSKGVQESHNGIKMNGDDSIHEI